MNCQATSRCLWLLFFIFPSAGTENLEVPTFQPGILYQYRYSLDTQLNYLSRSSWQRSEVQAEATVHVHLLWRNVSDAKEHLLQVEIHNLQVHHNPDHKKNKTNNSGPFTGDSPNTPELQQPIFLHWNKGKVVALYENKATSPLTLELKRGLASLLQFQTHSGKETEEDISGSCQVTYAVSKDSILKTKDLHSCIRPKFGFSSVNKIFEVLWQPTSKSVYSVDGSLLKSALAEENHVISLSLRSSIGVNITSRQYLELVTQKPGSKELSGISLQEALAAILEKPQPTDIASEPSKRICTQCPTLKNYLKSLVKKKFKMDVSKASTTWKFHRVVQMLRDANKKDIVVLLKKAPQNMVPFYVDAALAVQSTASLMALSEFLDFGNERQTPLLEKFLFGAAVSPRPSKELFRLVLDKMKRKTVDPIIWETGNLVIGTLVGKLCRMKLCELQEVRTGIETILQNLKRTRDNAERVLYLLALKNALLPETIPTFLSYAEEGSAAVSAAALSALQRYPTQYITSQVKMAMNRIFHQSWHLYPKTSRLIAAEIVLDNQPSTMDFINILLATRELEREMSRLLLSKIQSILHSHEHSTRQTIKDVLKDPQINNYYILSSRIGNSDVFSGPLAVTRDIFSTYGQEMLFTESGVPKKSTTNINVLSHDCQLQFIQVVLETAGFESLLGGSADDEEEQEIMTGMSPVLLDVQLRPVTFFQGYTDLVAKVLMSGSEPITVVRGNTLLIDHQQAIPLQSGLQGVLTVQGGLGLDISANVNVNLWDQELKTSIKTRVALTMDFQAEMDAPFFQATVRSQSELESALDGSVFLQLSGGLVCLQMIQEPGSCRESFLVFESSGNHNATLHKGMQTTFPGLSLPFHRTNSEMCKILLSNSE
ncbi:microsomal triglyceride transfer protein-like [Sphaerodactylus townsendi]|uniref:microsomal triglyceride transfer protein-like n=1 Tax=Sphaerodactylus townsendi TaxID=933632 RepID=UPI002026B0AF|nr:microsomal triglyceride transfer protein-like [Sphaerodactylus townsendi]XP_048360865.1 microsomal triglyceride transfer protein-like [Sphaerodactylus townsendi]